MGAPSLIYRLRNDFQELSRLLTAVEQFGLIHQLDPQEVYALHTAIEEVLTDSILNRSENDRAREIEVRVSVAERELVVEIDDDARHFNPLRASTPALAEVSGRDASDSGEEISSLGRFLAREALDDMEYRPQEHGNRLVLRKRLGRSPVACGC